MWLRSRRWHMSDLELRSPGELLFCSESRWLWACVAWEVQVTWGKSEHATFLVEKHWPFLCSLAITELAVACGQALVSSVLLGRGS